MRLRATFQFTHPGRGATVILPSRGCCRACFNSRTPGGVRPFYTQHNEEHSQVSIHAPREGCDESNLIRLVSYNRFNSRTPGGVRLTHSPRLRERQEFQFTHPGRGATILSTFSTKWTTSFNSRTPGGVRLVLTLVVSVNFMFQFTHPGRGATNSHK